MASRDRRRAERQKRKARTSERRAGMAAKTEAKNEVVRQSLVPLGQGERPGVVTIGALISTLISASIVIAYAAGANVNGDRPNIVQVVVPSLLMGWMAYGMWRTRYWAVIGFEAVLALLMVSATLGLVQATTLVQAMSTTSALVVASVMFFFMIRAMARIQMPERPTRD